MALSSSLVSLGVLAGIFGILALGLNLKFGFTGLLDIGHVAFFLTGAYLAALLVAPPSETQEFGSYILGWELPWIIAVLGVVIITALVGLLVALPAIRLREDYLAITVLGISVVFQRVIQSEKWLANGPDSLRGYPIPFSDAFPLPGTDPLQIVMLGVVVGAFWTAAAAGIGRLLGPRESVWNTLVHGAVAVTTLGIGYAAARLGDRLDVTLPDRLPVAAGVVALLATVPAYLLGGVVGLAFGGLATVAVGVALLGRTGAGLSAVAGGVGAGAIAIAGAAVGAGQTVAFVFLAAASAFTWLAGGLLVYRYYRDTPRRDILVAAGLAVGLLVALMPVILVRGTAALLVTVALLGAFIAGVSRLGRGWEERDSDTGFVSVLALGVVWLFLLRYFVLALIGPLTDFGVATAVSNLIQNVFWLGSFSATGIAFDYQRFKLLLTFGTLAGTYRLLQVTVTSPFGRVLKAIREDEDVATALGKNTFAYKVQGMMLGSAVGGLAGALGAIHYRALTFNLFAPRITFVAFLIVVIGGAASNRGTIVGALIYWGFWRATTDLAGTFPPSVRGSIQALRLAVFGALFIVILYYRPEGLIGEESIGGS